MNEPVTDREWADYLCVVLSQLDKVAERPAAADAPDLRAHVDGARDAVARLIGYLI
jgi:hypothetical protein